MARFMQINSSKLKWFPDNNSYAINYRGVVMVRVEFQLLDANYFINGNRPVVRLFGRKEDGRSVCVLVNGFEPYFYISTPEHDSNGVKKVFLEMEGEKLIKDLEEVDKFLPIGYRGKKSKLVKVICYSPRDVRGLREKYEAMGFVTYESDVLFKYRFLVDRKIHGMDWLSVECSKVYTTTNIETYETNSDEENFKIIEKIENAPLKYLSFDIECVSNDMSREINAKEDPIIMISFAFSHEFRGSKSLALCAKHVSPNKRESDKIPLKCFSEEREMLEEFLRVMSDYDPDIITGYNINGFDIGFVLERLRIHKLSCALGRVPESSFVRAFGHIKESVIAGRIVADPFQLLKRDVYVRLPRYDLGTAAKELLNDNKLDIKHKDMGKYWSTDEGTKKIIKYCLKDSQLALDLLLKKKLLDKFFELSKVSGVLLQDSLGGQSARIEVRVLHEFRDHDYLLPSKPTEDILNKRTIVRSKKGLKGAVVLEPKKGLHTKGCTLILDFKSLYPSLVITYNISPDTLLIDSSPELSDEQKHKSPLGDYFVNASVHKGMLPIILEGLMEARARAKKEMNDAETPVEKATLDARQSALKILLNSFYGYTGFLRARLYVMEVAGAITSYGRENLAKTRKLIKEKFGLPLIYADTDSAFVSTDISDLNKAKNLGDEISKYVTDQLPGVLELEFEKIYRTFLILTKKRYAGWSFSPVFVDGKLKWKDKIEMKGIETVRRDWCPLVSETMNRVVEIVLKEGDIKKAVEFVKDVVEDVRNNKVDMEKLVVVKGVTKSFGSYKGIQPHIELAKKINERNPGEQVIVGDRIGFIITRGSDMLSKRAETIEYIKEKGLEIDSEYYIERQLLPPVERILSSMGVEKNELLGFGRQSSISDIINGKQRVMKHEIEINHGNQGEDGKNSNEVASVSNIQGLCCDKCKKRFSRPTLNGRCECGGSIVFVKKQ